MPSLISDIVDSIHPSPDAVGVFLSDKITVLFDREIDEFSSEEGFFFVEGPDTDTFVGPDVGLSLPNLSDGDGDQLASPGYKGIVKGDITFEKISNTDLETYSGFDTSGSGSIWRSKLVFTPSFALQKLTRYTVYLSGDEDTSDSEDTGIRTRSIFDPVKGSNTGNGEVLFVGSYSGVADDTFNLKITTEGEASVAWFIWWKSSDPGLIYGPIRTEQIQNTILSDNVFVDWGTGNFKVNDTFSVKVRRSEFFTGNLSWSFTTGSGSIQTIPTTASSSIIGDTSSSVVSPSIFSVTSISPLDKATNQPLTRNRIVIDFNTEVDPETVTADSIRIVGAPVNGDSNIFLERDLYKNITVSGSKIILDI